MVDFGVFKDLASSCGPRCPISTCVDVQFQPASFWRAHSGPRCSISTCFCLASSFRAQMFVCLESSCGPSFWRAPTGPDFQIQLVSGELIPGPDFRCLNFRLASSSRAQTSIDLRRKRKMANGANTCAGRGRRLPPRSSAAFTSRGVGCYSERVEDVPRRRTIENHKFILELSS